MFSDYFIIIFLFNLICILDILNWQNLQYKRYKKIVLNFIKGVLYNLLQMELSPPIFYILENKKLTKILQKDILLKNQNYSHF